jgi:chromosome partitioning protein
LVRGEILAIVVAFLSQKGGVGKSTLARSLAVAAVRAGLKVKVIDLDPQQRTLMRWQKARVQYGVEPKIAVEAHTDAEAAAAAVTDADLIVLDMPGQLTDCAASLAKRAHLVVQPTSPSVDDLYPSLLVFQALQKLRVPRDKLAFALCRVLAEKEAEATRTYLQDLGYCVLKGAIAERLSYRDALNLGRALTESKQSSLNASAQLMMLDILTRVLGPGSGDKKLSERSGRHKD